MNPAATDDPVKRRNGIVSTLKALSGQSRQMVISRAMIDMCGGEIYPALILNQILHWSGVTKDPDGWFPHSYEEWKEETTLSKYHVMQAMKILSKMGIQTCVRRSPHHKFAPIVHYRVDDDMLGDFVQDFFLHGSSKILTNESKKLSSSDRKILSLSKSENLQQINTEMTPEMIKEKDSPIGDSLSGDISLAKGDALLEEAFAIPESSLSVKAQDSDSQPADSKTTEKILPPPRKAKAAAAEPAAPRPRTPLQEAVAYALNISTGARAGKIGKFFAGTLPREKASSNKWVMYQPDAESVPFSAEMLPGYIVAFTLWYAKIDKYKATYIKQKAVPNTAETLGERWAEFCERPAETHKYWFDRAQPVLAKLLKGEKIEASADSAGPVESAQAYKRIDPKSNSAYAVRTDPEDDPETEPTPVGALS